MAALAFVGADAEIFLQGQLTADMSEVSPAQWRRAAYCSPQGRMLASMIIARYPDGYVALLPADIADAVVARLSRFVLRAKVNISRLPATVEARVAEDDSPPAVAAGAVRHENGTWFFDEGGGVQLRLILKDSPTGAEASAVWRHMQIRRGIPWIDAAVSDKFVPQYVNWELLGGASFQKGCYVGQEIIARLYYIGKVKRRGYILHGVGQPPAAGDKIGEGAVAEIINAVGEAEKFVALASVSRGIGETLEWEGRTVRVQEPPYGLPTAAADQKARPQV